MGFDRETGTSSWDGEQSLGLRTSILGGRETRDCVGTGTGWTRRWDKELGLGGRGKREQH